MPSVNNGNSPAPVLRVLFVATSGGEGGIERYSLRLASLLRARGVAVTYACRPDGFLAEQCAQHGIPSIPWQVRNSGDIVSAFALAQAIRRHDIDIVHVHSRRDYVPAVLAARLAGCRRVLLHAHLIRALGEPPRLAGRFFQWGAAKVIAVSEAVRARLILEHRFPASFVTLLPNGVDVAAFQNCEGAALRRAWGIPAEALVIGMIGRLNAKGQDLLLRVGPELLRACPQLRFVLVGPAGDAHDRDRLLDQAAALGISERLTLPGMTEDVPAAMAAFDILAHLPADESFGLVLAEAMAAGLPTVATDIGGCREVVQDEITGFLVPLDDPNALEAALKRLLVLTSGPELRARLGAAGRQRVRQEFSLDVQVDRLYQLYQHLTAGPGLPARSTVNGPPRRPRVAPILAALALTGVTLTLLTQHRPHHDLPRFHTNIHVPLAPSPNPDVPRGRGHAAPSEV